MTVNYVLEQLFNGLCQGSIYALFAIGYAMIVGVVGLATFTHGEVIMLGAFSCYYFTSLAVKGMPGPLVLVLTAFVCFAASGAVGILVYKLCYERFVNAPRHISLVCTIGMSILLKNLAQIFFGTETKGMPTVIQYRSFRVLGINVGLIQIVVFAAVIVMCALLALFLKKARYGIIIKAISQDKRAAALNGVNVGRATLIGNVIGCGIGGIGGMLYALYYSSISPVMGSSASMKAFSSTVLGGMTDVSVSAFGGVIIGVLENFGIMLTASSMRDIFAFIFLIFVLLFMPQGLKLRGRKHEGR